MLNIWLLAPTGFELSIQNTTRNMQKNYYITDLQGTLDSSQTKSCSLLSEVAYKDPRL
jgi:hypothetical protein